MPSVCHRLSDQVAHPSALFDRPAGPSSGDTGRSAVQAREASPVRGRPAGCVLGGGRRGEVFRGDRQWAGRRRRTPLPGLVPAPRRRLPCASRPAARRSAGSSRHIPGGLPPPGHDPAGSDALALDGKSARGPRLGTTPAAHLPAAMTGTGRPSPSWGTAEDERNHLLRRPAGALRPDGVTVTADALHTQRDHARFLVGRRRRTTPSPVKRNQKGLYEQLRTLPWSRRQRSSTTGPPAMAAWRPVWCRP